MKIFKYILFLILIVIIGGSIYIATLDGHFNVEVNKEIKAPAEMLYNEVDDYKNWEAWGPWKEDDPDMVISYPEKTKGEGASYSWKSEASMDGSMVTKEAIPYKTILQEITFNTPFGDSKSDVSWKFEPQENGTTKVSWEMKGEQSFWEKAYQATQDSSMNQMLRPYLQRGLDKLAKVVTDKMEEFTIHVDGVTQYSGGFYLYTTTSSKLTDEALSSQMTRVFSATTTFMNENNIQMSGAPFTLYNTIDEANGTALISPSIPVSTKINTPDDSSILCGFMPSQKVIKTTLKGNYSNLDKAWDTAKNYMAENGYEQTEDGIPFEVYLTDPGNVPNPANWVTELYIPIKDKQIENPLE